MGVDGVTLASGQECERDGSGECYVCREQNNVYQQRGSGWQSKDAVRVLSVFGQRLGNKITVVLA